MILAIHIGGQKCGEIMETEKQCDARCRDSSQFLAKKWESYGKLSYEVMGYQWVPRCQTRPHAIQRFLARLDVIFQ